MVQSGQYKVCIPARELEMLAVSKRKALLCLAFLSIIDPCSSHCRQVGRRGKAPCPAAKGQLRAGSAWIQLYAVAVSIRCSSGQFLGDLVCTHAPASLTVQPAQNWLGDELPFCAPLSQGAGVPQ